MRQGLEQTGRFQVETVNSASEAVDRCERSAYAAVILDSDLQDRKLLDLIGSLHVLAPGLRVIAIPPDNDPHNPVRYGLPSQAVLPRPFYLPDLLKMVDPRLNGESAQPQAIPQPQPIRAEELPWLLDVSRAAQRLAGLLLDTASQAALMIRGGQLWAYAGQLPQASAQELAGLLTRLWNPSAPGDLARYIRLSSNGGQYLLYAKPLADDLVLALIYDPASPFSRVRRQTSQLAQALTRPPRIQPAMPQTRPLRPANPPAPSPTPTLRAENEAPLAWFKEASGELVSPSPTPPPPIPAGAETDLEALPGEELVPASPALPRSAGRLNPREPVSTSLYNLTYACVLIPRFPHHYLVGDLALRLGQWFPQISLAFGWRLEAISVRPEFVQWVTRVSPAAAPAAVLDAFRQQTSRRIFDAFPGLKDDNPSGDFWAPGFFLQSEAQPPSAAALRDFIQQTRTRQGI